VADKTQCVGTCSQKSTLSQFKQSKTIKVDQGFCCPAVQPDTKCAALEDASDAASQCKLQFNGGYQVVELPDSLSVLDQTDGGPIPDEDAVKLLGMASRISDWIMAPF
jgi:hypothetical protein